MAKQVKTKKNFNSFRSYDERGEGFKYIGPRRKEKLLDVGFVASEISREALKKKSPLFIRLAMEWENFVGVALAQTTQPAKLNQTTLTVKCQGPAAMELQYMIPQLLKRLNETCGLCGDQALTRIKILQDTQQSPYPPLKPACSLPSKILSVRPTVKEKCELELDKIESEALKAIFQKLLLKK
ncbi:DUF721 domain-containing protein [Acetobacteraceae bacterium]|nr:DUF721 domain-containing protein [Acetobacteraceae bacterium]